MNSRKVTPVNAPSVATAAITPVIDSAGKIEILVKKISIVLRCPEKITAPLAPHERGVNNSVFALLSPCLLAVRCAIIDSTFVNKNQLLRLIKADAVTESPPLDWITFNGMFGCLGCKSVSSEDQM